jgi:glutamyl-tRNA synthetase
VNASVNSKKIVTRFAPSPTGYLHIGGARTALFNWLYARRHGGEFKLRIEDTDRARSTDAAIAAIIDGMSWLALDWDGDVVYQFSRAARHAEVAHEMMDKGHAYCCWLSQDELAAMRAKAQEERRPFRVESPWRDRNDGPVDQPHVVRLKAPRTGSVTIDDKVQGKVTVNNEEIDDFVLLRSDGTPTYMLSVVVDDHDMGVTHVIRGDDHLNNAFRQLAVIHAMDWPVPVYAHVPLIHGADGAKLSKRHGAMGVDAYRDELGYLPEAINNYLLRLGWSHGDDELISREQALKWFDLEGVGKSPSRFDFKKLDNVNGHYLRAADDARLAGLAKAGVERKRGAALTAEQAELLIRAMPVLKVRAKSVVEIEDAALFLFAPRPISLDEKAKTLLGADSISILTHIHGLLSNSDEWAAEKLEALVKNYAESADIGFGKIAQPLRGALTGQTSSPGIFDVLVLLGREEALARIADQIAAQPAE